MLRKFLKFYIRLLLIRITSSLGYSIKYHHQLLIDFTCVTAKDELEKHPEMQTIAMVELENNFPSEFSQEVLKCLPTDVAKIIINPHTHVWGRSTLKLPKETLAIFIADRVEMNQYFQGWKLFFVKNFPIVSHLSKHLIVSGDGTKINDTQVLTQLVFKDLINIAQIYEQNRKVIVRSFDMTKDLTTFETFESSQQENLSQILFPDKAKNHKGQKLYVHWDFAGSSISFPYEGSNRPNNKWIPYLDIIAEKLNATLEFIEFESNETNFETYYYQKLVNIKTHILVKRLDFHLYVEDGRYDLVCYNDVDWCFLAPLPDPYSIVELILFLPMDKSCWMWLGITIAVSTLVWRISEGHWNFAFGAFSYFMGQAQLIIRIRTNRLTMKILLQILIFSIFIFSNGYQSLITSFMLEPERRALLRTVDEVFDSDLKIDNDYALQYSYKQNPKYKKAGDEGRLVDFYVIGGGWVEKMIKIKLAFTQECERNKRRVKLYGDGKSWKGLYVISEPVYTRPYNLFIRPFHPNIESFQELMDRSFEAGLHQAWERFYLEIYRNATYKFDKEETHEVDAETLNFELIAPSLYILVFGLPAALLGFLCEIFWKDFVSELTWDYFKRKWRKIFERKIKIQPKVRRIQVKLERKRRRNSI